MAIIRYTKEQNIRYDYLNIFPDQFKTDKEKENPGYIKNTMDYFAARAYTEYIRNRDTFARNYDLVKGILRPEDFYQEQEVKSFTEILSQDIGLPNYVKHYSIISTPLNELVGEISKRPDTYRVKAFDDDSKNEELEFRTQILQEYVMQQARAKIMQNNEDLSEEEVEQLTLEKVKDEIDSYTTIAERWSNRVLISHKVDFNLKEKGEEAFRDLAISAREFYHIYEDNSKTGFNITVENPKNVWTLTTPNKKYVSDPSGRAQGAYAAGTVHVMELSEIIETFPELTKQEIDHLRSSVNDYGLVDVRESNLGNRSVSPGIDSIKYDTYDELAMQERMIIESEIKSGNEDDGLRDFLGLSNNVSAFGYKYVVVRSYFMSKKKIGKVVFLDEFQNEQTILVDENYKSGSIPTQISLDWGWVNQMYQGARIGADVYHMKPFKLLNYIPIIGTYFEIKNTEARSIIDMMKPFQVIYNVATNQLFELLRKEIGNVASINIRRVPVPKDGDVQDALEQWEMEARERGIIFDDDSPENTKAPVSNQSVARNIDLTRTNEIQSRYNLAQQMKMECWELVGMSRQRLGSIQASETATATNTAIKQSYAQTEPLFIAHEYVLGQLYQAILDASVYIESKKPESTISYITSQGDAAFIKVNGSDISLRDLKVFATNRPEDVEMFNNIRMLAQPMLQNGGHIYDAIELYSTESVREMKSKFKKIKEEYQQQQQQAQQMEQQKMEQQAQMLQAELEEKRQLEQQKMENENYQNELDRINRKEVAVINALRFNENATADNNNDGVADALQITKMESDRQKAQNEYDYKTKLLNSQNSLKSQDLKIKQQQLQVDRENMVNDLQIAKEHSKNRNKK